MFQSIPQNVSSSNDNVVMMSDMPSLETSNDVSLLQSSSLSSPTTESSCNLSLNSTIPLSLNDLRMSSSQSSKDTPERSDENEQQKQMTTELETETETETETPRLELSAVMDKINSSPVIGRQMTHEQAMDTKNVIPLPMLMHKDYKRKPRRYAILHWIDNPGGYEYLVNIPNNVNVKGFVILELLPERKVVAEPILIFFRVRGNSHNEWYGWKMAHNGKPLYLQQKCNHGGGFQNSPHVTTLIRDVLCKLAIGRRVKHFTHDEEKLNYLIKQPGITPLILLAYIGQARPDVQEWYKRIEEETKMQQEALFQFEEAERKAGIIKTETGNNLLLSITKSEPLVFVPETKDTNQEQKEQQQQHMNTSDSYLTSAGSNNSFISRSDTMMMMMMTDIAHCNSHNNNNDSDSNNNSNNINDIMHTSADAATVTALLCHHDALSKSDNPNMLI